MIGRLVGSLCLAGAMVFAPTSASADDFDGTPGPDTITGTAGGDTIDGGDGVDRLDGGGGDDIVNGDAGGDVLSGGEGDDSVNGGGGGDNVDGNDGDDHLTGGDEADLINGDAGSDLLEGGEGDDLIRGGAQDDVISGGTGDDRAFGDDGDDGIDGDAGNDLLVGGAGDDDLYGDDGDDILCGGPGDDTLFGAAGDDLACAVDDIAVVEASVPTVLDLTENDESLDDEVDEQFALLYRIESVSPGIVAEIDPATGVLTFTASQSGTITYSVSRANGDPANPIGSWADLVITVLVDEVPSSEDGDDEGDGIRPVSQAAASNGAVLPEVGAAEDLRALGVLGGLLTMGGLGVVAAGRSGARRRS